MGVTGSLLFFTERYLVECTKQEFGSPLGDYDRWEQA